MNRREILKSSILLTGVIPASMVMAKKEEKITTIQGDFTISLVDDKGNIASECYPFAIEATPCGMRNITEVKFKHIQATSDLRIRIFLNGKNWRTSDCEIRNVGKKDTVTIEKGQFNMVWNKN
ncbi:MAG TPA: hypothetical protein VMY06_14940 [Sedimentisphaerales bacterium]|nr:hypothetical protein [Sedimentisphaerales bacterium]HUU15563.1 hypothetical protein [Sedimentisphaerales bacterium]